MEFRSFISLSKSAEKFRFGSVRNKGLKMPIGDTVGALKRGIWAKESGPTCWCHKLYYIFDIWIDIDILTHIYST